MITKSHLFFKDSNDSYIPIHTNKKMKKKKSYEVSDTDNTLNICKSQYIKRSFTKEKKNDTKSVTVI